MRVVRFTRPFRVWSSGEVAGFTPDMVDQLVRDGFAVEVDPADIEVARPTLAPSAEPVAVRFKRPHFIWNSGEVAGFPPAVAGKLVESGAAALLSDDQDDADSASEAVDPQPEAPQAKPRRRTSAD
jgi:hypothetical protein